MDLIAPMLAVPSSGQSNRRVIRLTDLAHDGWVAEPKYDGLRATLYCEGERPVVINRSGVDITAVFPELARLRLGRVVLDGEIVSRDGLFSTVATRGKQTENFLAVSRANPCIFVAFDILRSDGQDLTSLPLVTRHALLKQAVRRRRNVRTIRQTPDILRMWASVVAAGREGVICKQANSIYLPGKRAGSWVKFKTVHTLTAIAAGYEPRANRAFGAIVLALLDGDNPVLIGGVGTGWTVAQEARLKARLDAGECFPIEVEALNRTRDNKLRFPVFRGERSDITIQQAQVAQLELLPVY